MDSTTKKRPKSYEEWAFQRHPAREIERRYKHAEEGGYTVSELYGGFTMEPSTNDCTCHVCFLHGVRRAWPTLAVDRIPRKASPKVTFNPGPDGPAFPAAAQNDAFLKGLDFSF